jgi:hypothetical protein
MCWITAVTTSEDTSESPLGESVVRLGKTLVTGCIFLVIDIKYRFKRPLAVMALHAERLPQLNLHLIRHDMIEFQSRKSRCSYESEMPGVQMGLIFRDVEAIRHPDLG